MKRLLALAFALALSGPALAADNYAATEGAGKTFRCVDVGGVCYPVFGLANTTGNVWLYGNGATGTGSPRVTLSNDNTIPTGWPTAANQTSIIGTKNAGTAATNSQLTGCVYNATPLTLTDTQQASEQCDANGFKKVNVANANANGSATSANSSPVVIASDQAAVATKAASGAMASGAIASGAMVDVGAQADSVCSTDTGTCTLIALTKRNNARLTTAIGAIGASNAYETVAASQTAQAMGATGATGDFLSHCVATPGTTSPGVVTVLDNATAIVSFAGGASSVSNLVPFTIPIGAVSVSGAWKITTGANVTVVCFGRFT